MTELFTQPIPWYVAGPLIGLMLPLLWIIGNKTFGISSSFRHACASMVPSKVEYFNYDWIKDGAWNLKLVTGVVIGGVIAGLTNSQDYTVQISEATKSELTALGINNFTGLIPLEIFNWSNIVSPAGFVLMILGGFLVGFGARYAGGCTSGHAITGLATLQKASLIAVIGFFIGGLITTYAILPLILN